MDDKPIESTADTELYKLTLPMDITAAPQVCLLVVHAWYHAAPVLLTACIRPLPLSGPNALHQSSMSHTTCDETHNSMLEWYASNISSGRAICSASQTNTCWYDFHVLHSRSTSSSTVISAVHTCCF